MAKGSGGVGKGKGTSVSGGRAPAAAPAGMLSASVGEFADSVNSWAKSMGPLTAVSELYDAHSSKLGMSMQQFKDRILQAYRADKLELVRDERQLNPSPPAVLKASVINYGGKELTHIRVNTW